MAEDQNLIVEAILKYAHNEMLTERQAILLQAWYAQSPGNQALLETYRNDPALAADLNELLSPETDEVWEEVAQHVREDKKREGAKKRQGRLFSLLPGKWAIAAVVIVLLGAVTIWGVQSLKQPNKIDEAVKQTSSSPPVAVVAPDEKKHVVWQKTDGSKIWVDTLSVASEIHMDDDLRAKKTGEDVLSYEGTAGSKRMQWLAVGRQQKPFEVQLPDGTRAQFQPGAASSYFPQRKQPRGKPQFDGLDGVVYFKVKKNPQSPMLVRTKAGVDVEVLGTDFSIEADSEHQLIVKLITGMVRVKGPHNSLTLEPGLEAVLQAGRFISQPLTDANRLRLWVGEAPYFHFVQVDADSVVRVIASCFQLTVDNPDNIKGISITGPLPASRDIDEILQSVEKTQGGAVRIRRNGTRIVIARGNTL